VEDRQLLDVKLKKLIQVCKKTLNYKKLAVVGFILQSNLIDEIGLKLAFRLRKKAAGEKLYEYMNSINEFFWQNVHIHIFQQEIVDTIRSIELIFLTKRGEIALKYVKELFNVYFTLRNITIPNLQEEITLKDFSQESQLNYLSFLAKGKKPKSTANKVKPLLLHKISQKEQKLRDSLEDGFDENIFKEILKLQIFKKSINRSSTNKININGRLSDNLIYHSSQNNIIKFAIYGIFILFTLVTSIILYETIIFPYLTIKVSPILLLGLISCIFVFFLYRKYRKRS
jgi:hypothetical protein